MNLDLRLDLAFFAAFGAGLALFAVNLALLVLVVRRLFDGTGGVGEGGDAAAPSGGLTMAAFVLKLAVLAVGAYVALVLFDFGIVPFIGGLTFGLAATVLLMAIEPARRRIFRYQPTRN